MLLLAALSSFLALYASAAPSSPPPPTNVCSFLHIPCTCWNFYFVICCHCSLLATLSDSVGSSPSPSLLFFCSSPGFCYILHNSSKLCSLWSSHSIVNCSRIVLSRDKTLLHMHIILTPHGRKDRQFSVILFVALSLSLLVAVHCLLCLSASALLVSVASYSSSKQCSSRSSHCSSSLQECLVRDRGWHAHYAQP